MDKADDMSNKQQSIITKQTERPLVRVFLLGNLRLDWQVPPAEEDEAWSSRTSARDLFLLLLCMPERQASRSHLAGIMWPESEEKKALESLRSALKALRRVLSAADRRVFVEAVPKSDLLRLAEQEKLWVDLDAFHDLVEQASQQPDHERALPLWEQARKLLCGELLEGEQMREWTTCKWVRLQRKRLDIARRRLIRSLATTYIQTGRRAQAEAILSQHVLRFPTDQDALYRLMKLLIEEECFDEALAAYKRCERALAAREKLPAPHLQALSASVKKLNVRTLLPTHVIQQVQVLQESELRGEDRLVLPLPHTTQALSPLAYSLLQQHETAVPQMEAVPQAHLSRRDILQQFLGFVGTGTTLPHLLPFVGSQEVTPETVEDFAALNEICRHLSEGNELRTAEAILWSYLPRVESLVKYALGDQWRAASIASQGYLLAASLVGHRNDLEARQRYSEQALLYAKLARDLNLQVVALRQIAISFDYQGHPEKALQMYQRAIPSLNEVSPLLRACIYADLSGTSTQLNERQNALRFLGLAYDHFPDKPDDEPAFLSTICRYTTLLLCDGLHHLHFDQPKAANAIFASIDGLQPQKALPERIRIDVLNCQAETFLALREMEQACHYLEVAIQASQALGSQRRLHESYTLFLELQKLWYNEPRVRSLAQRFPQHLIHHTQ